MKERPILMSTPMVQAILSGRKTMTRRVVKNQSDFPSIAFDRFTDFKTDLLGTLEKQFNIKFPYGQIGDRLWVKETFCLTQPFDPETYYFGYKSGVKSYSTNPASAKYDYSEPDKWKPSIFMPREASRITLEITNIRVERLQDISEDDAKAEGALWDPFSYKLGFETLWYKINGKESWESNPYVWVIEFKQI